MAMVVPVEQKLLRLEREENLLPWAKQLVDNLTGTLYQYGLAINSGGGGGTITGSGAAGQVTYWTGATAIGGDAGLLYDDVNNFLTVDPTAAGIGGLVIGVAGTPLTDISVVRTNPNVGAVGLYFENTDAGGVSSTFLADAGGDAYYRFRAGAQNFSFGVHVGGKLVITDDIDLTSSRRLTMLPGGFIGLGTEVPAHAIDVQGATQSPATYAATMAPVSSGAGARLRLAGARGTLALPTAVVTDDQLGTAQFLGFGTAYALSSEIRALALETHSGTVRGSKLEFRTTAPTTTTIGARVVVTAKATGEGSLRILEPPAGTDYTEFYQPAMAGILSYALPTTQIAGALTNDGIGNLSWSASGVGTAGRMGPPGMDGEDGQDSFVPGPMGLRGPQGIPGVPVWMPSDVDDSDIPLMIAMPSHAHRNLLGLLADDHTQYALLAGRAGGQILIGGTSTATPGDHLDLYGASTGVTRSGVRFEPGAITIDAGDGMRGNCQVALNDSTISFGPTTADASQFCGYRVGGSLLTPATPDGTTFTPSRSVWTIQRNNVGGGGATLRVGGGFVFDFVPSIQNKPNTDIPIMGTYQAFVHRPKYLSDGQATAAGSTVNATQALVDVTVVDTSNSGTLGITDMRGLYDVSVLQATSGAVTIVQKTGIQLLPTFTANGANITVNFLTAVHDAPTIASTIGTAVVTTRRGLHFLNRGGSGAQTNCYAVDVAAQTSTTDAVALRSAIAAAANKFFLQDTGGAQSSLAGKFTTYNNTVTKGYGLATVVAAARSAAAVAAVASVATFTVGAADGTFRVSANVLVTTATAHSFTVTVAYTDEGNTARTVTFNFSTVAGVISNAAITNVAGAVPYEGIPLHIRCKAATAITIATTGTFTTVTYNVDGLIEQLA